MDDFIQEIEFIGNIGDGSGPPPIGPLQPSLFSISQTFFTALLTSVALLSLALFTDADAFHAPTVMNEAQNLLANENDGFAISFIDDSIQIKDTVTPANNYTGAPFSKLDFYRGSLAMHYDSAGVLKWAPHNLFLRSQEFNTTWSAFASSVTADQIAAPDGTTTADLWTSASTAYPSVSQNVTVSASVAYTTSLYVKAGNQTKVSVELRFNASDDSEPDAMLTLSGAGTVDTLDTGVTATITLVGNGWYRVTATKTNPGVGTTCVVIFGAATALAGTTVNGATLYFWGAQLEIGSTVGIYNPTTTTAYHGPRIDYDPATLEKRGYLAEASKTNLFQRSQEFDNTYWSKETKLSVTANAAVAPDGTTTMDKLYSNATGLGDHLLYNSVEMPISAGPHTLSVYAKKAELSWLVLDVWDESSHCAFFDLDLGVVDSTDVGVTATIQDVGNGIYRCTATCTLIATSSTAPTFCITNASYVFDESIDVNSGLYLWGAQFEAGSFASSYIPTTNVTVSRGWDDCEIPFSNFNFSQTVGSIYANAATMGPVTGDAAVWNLMDNLGQNLISGFAEDSRALEVIAATVTVASLSPSPYTRNVFKKSAVAFAANDFAVSLDGGAVSTDTAGAMPTSLSILWIGTSIAPYLNGWIKQLKYVPRRMSNAELQASTT